FKFISSNTIWIYLWHIPIVEYFHRYNVDVNFIFKYAIAVVLPVAITLIQVFWVKKTGSATLNKIFTG
ncbi:TPA: acyltransferase, partial [Klebsiella michiganensis]